MLNKLKVIQEISALVKLANRVSDNEGIEGESNKYGFLLTNRSFLVPAIGMFLNILILLNFPILAPIIEPFSNLVANQGAEYIAEYIIVGITVISAIWSFIERWNTKAKVVVTKTQAKNAVKSVVKDDKLAKALIEATSR